MDRHVIRKVWISTVATLVLLALAWAVSTVLAQGPDDPPPPDAPDAAPADVLAPDGGSNPTMAFSYQGILEESGSPANGYYDFYFYLYNSNTGGVSVVCETPTSNNWNYQVVDGLYTFYLICGDGNTDAFQGSSRWLEVWVKPTVGPTWTQLTPRQPVSPVPYAFSLYPHAVISYSTTGTEFGDALVNINAQDLGGGFAANGLLAQTTTGSAVLGRSGDGIGLQGSTEDGYGVYGYDVGLTPGRGYGGYFYSSNGVGVYGESSSANDHPNIYAPGVYGKSQNGIGVLGYSWRSNSSWTSAGVMGYGYANPGGKFASYSGNIIEGYEDLSGNSYALSLRFKVTYTGEVYADGGYHCGKASGCWTTSDPADFAEVLPAAEDPEPGDVLIVGADGVLVPSTAPYQTSVVGVYSTAPQYIGGGANLDEDGYAPLAIVGVVPVKACAENGPIVPGDLLTSSSTPGHAMRAGDAPPVGTVIGKALEGLESGAGVIQILVTLQ